jgi:NADH:ubiquinone oxidoreductase subunit 6 (subunit J)
MKGKGSDVISKSWKLVKKLNRLQKILGIGAVVFVFVYIGAVVITVQSRIENKEGPALIEAPRTIEKERHLLLPELLLPMGILLVLAASYLIVKRRNEKTYENLDDDIDETAPGSRPKTGV